MEAAPEPHVWALFGRRMGDNRQIEALAEATGLPWTAKRLSFAPFVFGRSGGRGGSLRTLTPEARAELQPPWPDVVIAAGKRSAPAALWIRSASGERTRLAHLGRPWSPLAWFDLVVTTPQYGLPARPNVLENLLPLTAAPARRNPGVDARLDAGPRPRLVLLAGGDSRPYVLDAEAARRLALEALALSARSGGSLIVATSPRTSPVAVAALRETLAGADRPVRLSVFGEGPDDYRAILASADRFLVTDDSAAMTTEAALTGAPVTLFRLPQRPDLRTRLATGLRAVASATRPTRQLFERLVDRGIVTSIRDLDRFMARLDTEGLLAGGDAARRRAESELAAAAERVLALAAEARLPRP